MPSETTLQGNLSVGTGQDGGAAIIVQTSPHSVYVIPLDAESKRKVGEQLLAPSVAIEKPHPLIVANGKAA